jgi:uncharacterized protein (DUF58 family)
MSDQELHNIDQAEAAPELRAAYQTVSPAARQLFDAEFLGQLEYLRIVSRRAFAGVHPASRRGRRPGAGLEFAEHRPYTTGDDFRYLDWAAYGRLERLLLRLFQQDEDLAIALLVDVSDSMLGSSTETDSAPAEATARRPKVDLARQLAAALAYIGLSNLDRIRLSVFADGEVAVLRTRRGRGQVFSVLDFLAAAPLGGQTGLLRAAEQFQRQAAGPGLVVMLSDFLDLPAGADGPAGFESALGLLAHRGHEVWALRIEAPEEIRPPWQGEAALIDAESGRERRVRLTPEAVAVYERERAKFVERFERWTTEHGVAHLGTTTDMAVDKLVLEVFRRGGFLK